MTKVLSYAAISSQEPLELFEIERRELRNEDVEIDILYCGICHSDLHVAKNEWKRTIYPCVPGHEILGVISKVGSSVSQFKLGDIVGVGCIIGSCKRCPSCSENLEQYCDEGYRLVFNSQDPKSLAINYGGFSEKIIVDASYVLAIPKELCKEKLASVAPLLCAGITTYSPLKTWNITQGKKVGIVGLGGLGHMAVKIANAMGAEVTVFTTSPQKEHEAKKLGATHVINSKDPISLKKRMNQLDFILDTVAFLHDLAPYLECLKRDGTLCLVGLPSEDYKELKADSLIRKRKRIAGSLIGSIEETKQMLAFCAKHEIYADVELIPIQMVNEAFDRMIKNDVRYRFVIDMKSIRQSLPLI